MKRIYFIPITLICLLFAACDDGGSYMSEDGSMSLYDSGSSGSSETGNGNELEPGVITAGEWNDLDHWMFLDSVLTDSAYAKMPEYWGYYHNHRVSVKVTNASDAPVINQEVVLKRNGTAIWTAKTDNAGMAELWVDLFQKSENIDTTQLQLSVGSVILNQVKTISAGANTLIFNGASTLSNKVELAFMVDATGSMSDELEFLKTELLDVINRAKSDNPTLNMLTGSVFYRDKGDDYVTRISNFNTNITTTLNFIKDQKASGGGDFPEAVHTALDKSINELQWSTDSRTRILFMVLDAPPHYDSDIVSNLHSLITQAAVKGIKIIPVTASGIDKETEFLMRFMALTTNGTYVFITNDSGVGNEHLQPTIGYYQVEYLNDLMVRLINKYVK
ncbi:MAG: hypothetical protein PHS59_14730 [Paludibacter sp.]|nr:hypothetical protein [Paludibacter sp.]